MVQRCLLMSVVAAAIVVVGLANCNNKPKAEGTAKHPAVTKQGEPKEEATKPAAEHPDSGKPKDHPAH